MPESVRLAHPANTTQSRQHAQHIKEPQSHRPEPQHLPKPAQGALAHQPQAFVFHLHCQASTSPVAPLRGWLARGHPLTDLLTCSAVHGLQCRSLPVRLLLQLRKSRVRVVGRGGRGRLVGRVTVPGLFCGAAHRTLCGSCLSSQSSDSPGLSLLFCFFSFQVPHFLHRSRVRPTSGSRARVRFPLALVALKVLGSVRSVRNC
ncbi:hypothetical protein B0H65DRAFT_53838 [Neurospora tetraspora]|uniref:Uncharacterized protein n=1 Tax=Neurospora tetraspora TaxID=94610 RepID=A0AAE0JQ03_9PEZI|nr:hypothetical protein B0H65DRAFT_53838 [Neurospora tetraspora]